MAQVLEENDGKIPSRLKGYFSVEVYEADRARRQAEREERRRVRAAARGE